LRSRLTRAQLLSLEIWVWLLQVHKNVKIEKLAAYYPLPIKYESRRRRLQRIRVLPSLSIALIWFPIIKEIIQLIHPSNQPLYLALDRTQWQDKNLFVVAFIHQKRALPEVRFPKSAFRCGTKFRSGQTSMRDTIALGSHLFIGNFYQRKEPVTLENKKLYSNRF
jgi:hypothetical protein